MIGEELRRKIEQGVPIDELGWRSPILGSICRFSAWSLGK